MPAKRANVRLELRLLEKTWRDSGCAAVDVARRARAAGVNERLWEIEDRIRDKEAAQTFDARVHRAGARGLRLQRRARGHQEARQPAARLADRRREVIPTLWRRRQALKPFIIIGLRDRRPLQRVLRSAIRALRPAGVLGSADTRVDASSTGTSRGIGHDSGRSSAVDVVLVLGVGLNERLVVATMQRRFRADMR